MSFLVNFLFGKHNVQEDPTGLVDSNSAANNLTEAEQPVVEQKFTPKMLNKYNGHDDPRIFIAIKGNVYDCTKGRQFYGPSGPYNNFAGHDASRGLALNSFEIEHVKEWHEPIDDLKDLTDKERTALDDWEAHFKNKYTLVGQLVSEN
ncbi:hypothetical protein ACO0QE_002358 [Hanseniaspora vineae]